MSNTTDQKEGMLTMKTIRFTLAAMLGMAILATSAMQPARADGAASTRNIILGAAALIAGAAIESNAAHKRQVANSVVGYLPDGAVVYQDGRVVLPNGRTYYPGQYGQTVACSNNTCYISGGNGNAPYYRNASYNGNNTLYGNAPYNGNTPYYGNAPYNGNTPYYGNGGQAAYNNTQRDGDRDDQNNGQNNWQNNGNVSYSPGRSAWAHSHNR
jgi:hypothetical protein